MSCSSCNCNPCSCEGSCDPNNEPLASALDNFITQFFGTLQKTCVNDQVVWILPCDLATGSPLLPRNAGEGIACYLLRLFGSISAPPCTDFRDKIFINGLCWSTWQQAYDANSGATVPTMMLVGPGTAYGDLTLSANYNPNIIISGFGTGISQLGTLFSAQHTVVLEAWDTSFTAIDTRTAGIGNKTVTLTGRAKVGIINNSRSGGVGSGATISAQRWDIDSIDSSGGTGASGNVILLECSCSGNINVSSTGSTSIGNVIITKCDRIGSIINTGSAGYVTGTVLCNDCYISANSGLNAISSINTGSSFINSTIRTIDTAKDCIANVVSSGAQFINTTMASDTTGVTIQSSTPKTIIAYNLTLKNDVGANVTLSEGNYFFSPNITIT